MISHEIRKLFGGVKELEIIKQKGKLNKILFFQSAMTFSEESLKFAKKIEVSNNLVMNLKNID